MALMSFSGFDPFGGLLDLQNALDRLLQNPGLGLNLGLAGTGVFPGLNMFNDNDGLVVRAEVPGIAADQMKVTVEPSRLTISGKREPAERDKGSYHRIAARMSDGVIELELPKAERAKPRRITVTK